MRIAASARFLVLGLALAGLAGCAKRGDIAAGGIIQFRSACPIVAIPAYTGNLTLFNPPESRDSKAIDVVAEITDVDSNCQTVGSQLYSHATFKVNALRSAPGPARDITLPYFSTVVRGATAVVAKRIGQVTVHFDQGAVRASATAQAGAYVDKAAATLPPDIERMITRPRKSGQADAAIDPLAQPKVKEAIKRTSFEVLIGFNLTQDQLRYNVTR